MSNNRFTGSKRERALDEHIDDNFDIMSGRFRAVPEDQMSALDKRIRRMDEKNASREPKMHAKPLYQYSAKQRQAYYGLVGAIAQTVEDNIIRPKDPATLNDLRRRESASHNMSSSTSVSLYKTRTPNVRYASQGPLGWLQQPGAVSTADNDSSNSNNNSISLVDTWARNSTIPKHAHNKDDVLILDVRYSCGANLTGRLPSSVIRNILFPYFTLAPNEKTVLQRMSQHNSFVRFAEEFAREEMRGTLDDVMKRSGAMSFFAVRFLYDEQIQLVYNMDLDAIYYGVLVFSLLTPAAAIMTAGQAEGFRARVKSEIVKERDKDSEKAKEPAATLTALVSDATVLEELEQMRMLGESYCKPHNEVSTSVGGTKVDRLIARSCPLSVYRAEKSASLLAAPIKFEYYHFASCQCVLDDSDITSYKETHGKAARVKPSLIPAYDSDIETKKN